ncbi:MAG: exosortase/archaeosortase family protein [Firmicutes bacterium]|nr:exosortase/archaeosortase family protein [Bacillota bacterium]
MSLIPQKIRLIFWLLLSAVSMIGFTRSFWTDFIDMFSYGFIIDGHHAAPYGMMVLCLLFLLSRRNKLKEEMARPVTGRDYMYIAVGLALITAAVILPGETDFVLLKLFMTLVGAFAVVFGRAAKTPAVLLAVFAAATTFPLFVASYFEWIYAKAAIIPLKAFALLLGLPLGGDGQILNLLTGTGQSITVMVKAACAGPSTMGFFLGLFGLMYMDMPLPLKRVWAVFAFGVAGTWLQSVIRLLIILAAGHYLGENALWTAHFWTIYLLFPAWYLVFVLVYFKQAGGKKIIDKAVSA